jgi:CBS domain-containing membrane protein
MRHRGAGTKIGPPSSMYVRDLMRRELMTLEAADNLDLADGIMRLGRIRHLPVVSGGRLVGILSQRDLVRAAVSSLLQLRGEAEHEWLATIPVHAVMTPHVFTVAPSVSLRVAVDIMLDKRIGCLPVVDDGTLVGLLSESDCLRHLAHLLEISEEKERLPELAPGG